VGHDIGDAPDEVVHPIMVRPDSAGVTHGFVRGLVEANCDLSIGSPVDGRVRDALPLVQEVRWQRAIETHGTVREGAWVTELTEMVDLAAWPGDPRLIMRRERPHPGAQLTLSDTSEGFRHTCFITSTDSDDICALELRHRGHARVEHRVRSWKDCGLANLPFEDFCRNEAWVATSLIAGALLAWSQMACFEGARTKAEPKSMRYRVLHVAALLVRKGRGRAPARQDVAVGQRPVQGIHPTPDRHPLNFRVPVPDPKALLQGATTEQQTTTTGIIASLMPSDRHLRRGQQFGGVPHRRQGAGRTIEARAAR
jgi:hypothetical protein